MNVVLVMFKADGERREFPLPKHRAAVLGRKNTCDLRIPLSSVSREHCKIELRDDGPYIRDLGSRNGTLCNNVRIHEAKLSPGDRIRIGPVHFIIVIDGNPSEIPPVKTVIGTKQPGGPRKSPAGGGSAEVESSESEAAGGGSALAALASMEGSVPPPEVSADEDDDLLTSILNDDDDDDDLLASIMEEDGVAGSPDGSLDAEAASQVIEESIEVDDEDEVGTDSDDHSMFMPPNAESGDDAFAMDSDVGDIPSETQGTGVDHSMFMPPDDDDGDDDLDLAIIDDDGQSMGRHGR